MRNHDSYHVYFSPNPREKSRNSHLHYASKIVFWTHIAHLEKRIHKRFSPLFPSRRSIEKKRREREGKGGIGDKESVTSVIVDTARKHASVRNNARSLP